MLHLQRHALRQRWLSSRYIIRHRSTLSSRLRNFPSDVYDAEKRGILEPPPTSHPRPILWRVRSLFRLYSLAFSTHVDGIAKTPLLPEARTWDEMLREKEIMNMFLFLVLMPFSPVLFPEHHIPITCRLPAQAERVREWHRARADNRIWPATEDIEAARNMLLDIGTVDSLELDNPDVAEFWVQHGGTLWMVYRDPEALVSPRLSRLAWVPYALEAMFDEIRLEDRFLREKGLPDGAAAELLLKRGLNSKGMSPGTRDSFLSWWLLETKNLSDAQIVARTLDAHLALQKSK